MVRHCSDIQAHAGHMQGVQHVYCSQQMQQGAQLWLGGMIWISGFIFNIQSDALLQMLRRQRPDAGRVTPLAHSYQAQQ